MARRRYLIAGLAAIAVFGSVAASAATLGGVTADSLGADVTTVAACDNNGVGLSYATSFAAGAYQVTAVTVTGIAPGCNGKNLRVTLTDSSGASVFSSASQAVSVPGTADGSATVSLGSSPVSASAVSGAAVIIGS